MKEDTMKVYTRTYWRGLKNICIGVCQAIRFDLIQKYIMYGF